MEVEALLELELARLWYMRANFLVWFLLKCEREADRVFFVIIIIIIIMMIFFCVVKKC